MAQATFVKDPGTINYTPVGAVSAGDVVVQGLILGIAKTDIAAGALGALAVEGEFDVVKKTGAIVMGAVVFWDADGSPVSGTASSGAASPSRSAGDLIMGHAVSAAASGDTTVRVRLTHYTS